MTKEQKNQLTEAFYALGFYYGKNIDEKICAIMASEFFEYDFNLVVSGLKEHKRNSSHFPSVRDIIKIIDPVSVVDEKTVDELINCIPGRIRKAIEKFGQDGYYDAKSFLTEAEWDVVSSTGWGTLCHTLGVNYSEYDFRNDAKNEAREVYRRKPELLKKDLLRIKYDSSFLLNSKTELIEHNVGGEYGDGNE